MKIIKSFSLTLFLIIGFIMPSCDKDNVPEIPPCDDVGPLKHFYDVFYMTVSNLSDLGRRTEVPPNDTIAFDELDAVFIDYIVNYSTSIQPKRDWSFSLMPTAYACTYVPGTKGSKTETLVDFSISTLNDFDDDHLANSSIIDLFDYYGGSFRALDEFIPLTQFLEEQIENLLQEEDMFIKLKKAPEMDQEFKIKVVMELSKGEVYEFETEPIVIIP